MTAPVRLDALTFAHQPADPATSALAVRRDATRAVLVPEWRRGSCVVATDAPVAYAVGALTAPVVLVQLSRTEATVSGGLLRAVDPLAAQAEPLRAQWGNLLGDVAPVAVTFPDDQPVTVAAPLAIPSDGVDVRDGTWRWQWQATGATDWTDVAETAVRVYLLLAVPTLPWAPAPADPTNTQLPWTSVLDYTCSWARGATTTAAAAAAITQAVYDLGPELVEYGCPILAQTQYSTPTFDCTAFLDRLHGGIGNGRYVNCTDCATIVSSFANSVGCDLWQSTMWTLNDQGILAWFATNEMVPIGGGTWRMPCGWLGFNYHEVAWSGECDVSDEVYDACLLVDGDADPVTGPHAALLAAGLVFGQAGDGAYRDRLAAPSGRGNCAPQPHTRQRRRVT